MNTIFRFYAITFYVLIASNIFAQQPNNDNLLYHNSLSSTDSLEGWKMEGAGKIECKDGWMTIFSENEKGHHVFWCPVNFPENFIAEWEVKNLNTKAGLCIVFFAAKGLNGEDIFDSKLPKRNGTFKQYTNGAMNCYHVSYYANAKGEKGRETANLRKNRGFKKVQAGEPGIPLNSTNIHKIQLIKNKGHITMFIDNRKIIDWTDDGKKYGPILTDGKIGFRQMKWTRFAYRNFNVWSITP